jgi:hypothetical protein
VNCICKCLLIYVTRFVDFLVLIEREKAYVKMCGEIVLATILWREENRPREEKKQAERRLHHNLQPKVLPLPRKVSPPTMLEGLKWLLGIL